MCHALQVKDLTKPRGLDNLLYSSDVFFSCFADLALTSPVEYYKEGQGSLMQCVITPALPYFSWTNEQIAKETDRQVCARCYACSLHRGCGCHCLACMIVLSVYHGQKIDRQKTVYQKAMCTIVG